MEDYIDNTTSVSAPKWWTADPFARDGALVNDLSILKDAKKNCVRAWKKDGKFVSAKVVQGPTTRDALNVTPFFVAEQLTIEKTTRDITFDSVANEIQTRFTAGDNACVVGRNGNELLFQWDSSSLVKDLAAKGVYNMLSRNSSSGFTPTSYSALHLRRGDKCRGIDSVRCGSAEDMPFLDLCRMKREEASGFYVATNERDEAFLGTLRQHGCLLFEDLHLDFEKEAKKMNQQRGGRWKSVHGAALEYMVEAHIVQTAEVAYSMGSSSLDRFTKFFRIKKGYNPTLLFDEEKGRFLEDGGDLKAKEVEITGIDTLSSKLPLHVLQYGPARTASTLQFQIVCLSMFKALLSSNNASLLDKMECGMRGEHRFVEDTPMVLKTHMLEYELPSKLPEDTWLFATSRSNSSSSKLRNAYSDWRSKGYDIRYIQDLSLASEREHLIALEYQSIFGLTNKNMQDIIDFLKYWDVLRRCCGMQMSRHWRAHLMSRDKVLGGVVDSSKVSFCQGHNISSIENDFMATKLYQELKVRPKLHPMLSPSNVDDVLDGSYCSRYNDFVRNTGAHFNEPLPTDLSPGDGAVPGDQSIHSAINHLMR